MKIESQKSPIKTNNSAKTNDTPLSGKNSKFQDIILNDKEIKTEIESKDIVDDPLSYSTPTKKRKELDPENPQIARNELLDSLISTSEKQFVIESEETTNIPFRDLLKTVWDNEQKDRVIYVGQQFLNFSRINENSKAEDFHEELKSTIINTLKINTQKKTKKNYQDKDEECEEAKVKPKVRVDGITGRSMLTAMQPIAELDSIEPNDSKEITPTKGVKKAKKRPRMLHFIIGTEEITKFGYIQNFLGNGNKSVLTTKINELGSYEKKKNGKDKTKDIKQSLHDIINTEAENINPTFIPNLLVNNSKNGFKEITVADIENYKMDEKQRIKVVKFLNRLMLLLPDEIARRPAYKESKGYKLNKGEKETYSYAAKEFMLFNSFLLLNLWVNGHIDEKQFFDTSLNLATNIEVRKIPEVKLENILLNAWKLYLQKMHSYKYSQALQQNKHIFLKREYLHQLYLSLSTNSNIPETPGLDGSYITPEKDIEYHSKKTKYETTTLLKTTLVENESSGMLFSFNSKKTTNAGKVLSIDEMQPEDISNPIRQQFVFHI